MTIGVTAGFAMNLTEISAFSAHNPGLGRANGGLSDPYRRLLAAFAWS
jgi:hypothetical protein